MLILQKSSSPTSPNSDKDMNDNSTNVPSATTTRRKLIVVTRLLESYGKPVVTHVEFVPSFEGLSESARDDQIHQFTCRVFSEVKDRMCKEFVEMLSAEWTWQYCDVDVTFLNEVLSEPLMSQEPDPNDRFLCIPSGVLPGTNDKVPKAGMILFCIDNGVNVEYLVKHLERFFKAIGENRITTLDGVWDRSRNRDEAKSMISIERTKALANNKLLVAIAPVNSFLSDNACETYSDLTFYVTNGMKNSLLIQCTKTIFVDPAKGPDHTALVIPWM